MIALDLLQDPDDLPDIVQQLVVPGPLLAQLLGCFMRPQFVRDLLRDLRSLQPQTPNWHRAVLLTGLLAGHLATWWHHEKLAILDDRYFDEDLHRESMWSANDALLALDSLFVPDEDDN